MRQLAGLYQDLLRTKSLRVAIPHDVMGVLGAPAGGVWRLLDVVEHTEQTIERVLRRELTGLFGKWRRPGVRTRFVRRSPPRPVRP